ncbi:MAG: hypothetical protein ACOCVF_01085 [bacterium]
MKKEININKGDECTKLSLLQELMIGIDDLDLFEKINTRPNKVIVDWLGAYDKTVSKKPFKIKFSIEIIEE